MLAHAFKFVAAVVFWVGETNVRSQARYEEDWGRERRPDLGSRVVRRRAQQRHPPRRRHGRRRHENTIGRALLRTKSLSSRRRDYVSGVADRTADRTTAAQNITSPLTGPRTFSAGNAT
jgi:hypothetical protein